jgi:hypothetical protein
MRSESPRRPVPDAGSAPPVPSSAISTRSSSATRATRIETASASAYLRAFVSDSLTMKYAASSRSSGSSSATTSSVTDSSPPTVSDSRAGSHRQQPLLRPVVQVAPDAPALSVGGFDHACARAPQGGRLMAALHLGRRPRREDAHGGDVIVAGLHPPGVHHRHVTEMRAVGGAQADREVALEAHLDRRLGFREALRQGVGERHDRSVHDERAWLALRVVLERLIHPGAVVPAADDPYVLAVGLGGLGDEGELRFERDRHVADQASKELVADRTRGPFGDGTKQVSAAEPRAGPVGVGDRRHEPLEPGIDASAPERRDRGASPLDCEHRLASCWVSLERP